MTTRWPCIVVAVLSLLAIATSASAECAWVWWEQEETVSVAPLHSSERWESPIAFRTLADCEAHLSALVQAWKEGKSPAQSVTVGPGNTSAEFRTTTKGISWIVRRYCLPDTVDPRGPKGK